MTSTAPSTTNRKNKTPASSQSNLPPTRGSRVCRWIESNLVHAEGDFYGQPFRLRVWQKAFIYRLYEQNPDGTRKHRKALWGLPKGNGKTEILAAIGLYELCGGDTSSPDIPVGAASYEQADLLFGAAHAMVTHDNCPLKNFVEPYEKEILLKGKPGRLYKVAAAQGTNDGKRPTCFIADELHEWVDRKERVHIILSNGLAKRQNSLELNITTAGHNLETLCGRMYQYGKRVLSGELDDPTFLFEWWEAPEDADLTTQEGLEAAIRSCNPAVDDFWPIENLYAKFNEIPEYEFRRYFLNQWTATAEQWLPSNRWQELADPREVPEGAPIAIGFDGSYNNDSTALVACTLDGYTFVLGSWEKLPNDPDSWVVPRDEVDAAVHNAFQRFKVVEMACDPNGWHQEMQAWGERYGDVVMEYPPTRARMVPACSRFYTAVTSGDITHDGNPALARHLTNAVVKETYDGAFITKDGRNSPRKIDLAVAAVIAYERATWRRENAPQPGIYIFDEDE